MYSDDLLQRRLYSTANRSHNETYQFAKDMSDEPFSLSDMYAFQNQLQDMSNTNWASSQYTQFKFGMRKAVIDAIS
ncbi:type III secretion protein HrpF [Pantoea stewartii]|uniref:type III secretion protein HrpF n=1 Tax=Pantoea stewartii TaxID=66269 RepID=UPI0021D4D71A|nr:type III secretion protein HrpF [Pantoea stewartii]MCU7369222.1 type III secretion protein HrpF [Pantoea stewartii]